MQHVDFNNFILEDKSLTSNFSPFTQGAITMANKPITPVGGHRNGYQTGYETGYRTGYETGYQTGGYQIGDLSTSDTPMQDPKRGFAAAREKIEQQYTQDAVNEVDDAIAKNDIKSKLLAKAKHGNLTMFNDRQPDNTEDANATTTTPDESSSLSKR